MSSSVPSASVRTVSLNDVVVGSKPTHIVIYQESNENASNSKSLEVEVKELRERVADLEKIIKSLDVESTARSVTIRPSPSPFFHSQISGPLGLEVRRLDEPHLPVETLFETLVKSVRATPALAPLVTPSVPEAIRLDEKEPEEEEPDQELDQEEKEEEEEQEEEEEEEESMELTEFEYKGATYYRDAENQVYQKDDNGDLDDDPIGVWNESKQKVLKYPKK